MKAPRRVLVVEDRLDCRWTLRLLLEGQGFQVQEAADGEEGVRKALAWKPDAAVVDLGLPGLTGFEVARLLREGLGRSVPIIALTAYDDAAHRSRAAQSGFSAFLAKPADPDDVVRLLGPV